MIKILRTILLIFLLLVFLIYFGVYPWIKSKSTADDIETARKDEFIQLFPSAKLEFMGGFLERIYDGGGKTGSYNNTNPFKECNIVVYKIDDNTAYHLEKTKGVTEINKYLNNLIFVYNEKTVIENNMSYNSDNIDYLKKYKINYIKEINYSYENKEIRYFDKKNSSHLWDRKYYRYYKNRYVIPDFFIEKKIKCLFDNDQYYAEYGDIYFDEGGVFYYMYTRFNRIYPYYFSFYSLSSYRDMIEDKTGFYIVIPDADVVYVLQPKHNRIFKLY